MKPDWDADSPRLRRNLHDTLNRARAHAAARRPLSVALMRDWHARIMSGLEMADPGWAGCYRGEGAAAWIGVSIGGFRGVAPSAVAEELGRFEATLVRAVAGLDLAIDETGVETEDELRAVINLCAWAHGEWVRIHPFANGSGRTARLWANHIAMRYGLPPFVRLRPRPDGGYEAGAAASMTGDWKKMIPMFDAMLATATKP